MATGNPLFAMHTASLRKLGGSTMLAVPTAFLEQLHLKAGSIVSMEVDQGKRLVAPYVRIVVICL